MLEHWALIESDLADRGVDVGDQQILAARSWRWLRSRIIGLLSVPIDHEPWTGAPVFHTRLQAALAPPTSDAKSGSG